MFVVAAAILIDVGQGGVGQNGIAQFLERLNDRLPGNDARVVPPFDVGVVGVEIAFVDSLEKSKIHLLRHRGPFIS